MVFEQNGMLPPGIHDYTLDEFLKTFVNGFPPSQTRTPISHKVLEFFEEVFEDGIPHEIWIDGSFSTTKINPNDADIVVFLNYSHILKIQNKTSSLRFKYLPRLDTYFTVAVSPENQQNLSANDYSQAVNNRNYWRGQFGFDRSDNPKGIIRISPQSIVDYLKAR